MIRIENVTATAAEYNNNAFFMLSMSIIVFLMQCGFAFLEAGSVRSKNTTNILIKNLLSSCICGLCYFSTGWAFAYGFAYWFFQFVFGANAATIISGAVAERCEFIAYGIYSAFMTSFVYPVVTHWCWSEKGWLFQGIKGIHYLDFAGSGCVHLMGGTASFVGALILGPRLGRFANDLHPTKLSLKGHSLPFAALGGFLLTIGFFAFNGGSQRSISHDGDGEEIGLAMTNTMLAGASAAMTVLLYHKINCSGKKWSLSLSINALLTGFVMSCAGCHMMRPWATVICGTGAGIMYLFVSWILQKIEVDDPLEATAVHFGGGLWGLFITPIMMDDGIVFARDSTSALQLGWNMVGALAIIFWTVFTMGTLFAILNALSLFRVSRDVETRGLDIHYHGEAAYPLIAYGHGWGGSCGVARGY